MSGRPLYEFDEGVRDLLIRTSLKVSCKADVISKSEGAFGDVYRLDKGAVYPRYLAAKCPKIARFGSREKASEALESVLHEVEKSYRVLASPWVNRFTDIQIVHGWPFLISRWHDGTLADLIANPLAWTVVDRLSSLLLIVRGLRQAAERGISAHQDLKPENVFFIDLHRKFPELQGSQGLHYHMLLGDFGNADAFRDIGRNTGTRPYMAPEQFQESSLDGSAGAAIDIFALGVIAHECLCDGLHPIGKVTTDVWPRRQGVPRKWGEARVWREWAESERKELPVLHERCPPTLFPLLSSAMAPDPAERPSLETVEQYLWKALEGLDGRFAEGIRLQVDWLESLYQSESWPYFDERLDLLRSFYAKRK